MAERDEWLTQDDAGLLADCEVDTYRSSGPGGQHRNKTSSAVRLRHGLSGLVVIAEEDRSQHANKRRAIRRLRLAIALKVRAPWPAAWFPADAVGGCLSKTGRIEVALRNPIYPRVVAEVLDAVGAHDGALREAAATLGTSTSQLSRFIVRDGKVMAEVNRVREQAGLRPLSSS